jgi:hypothetical protein
MRDYAMPMRLALAASRVAIWVERLDIAARDAAGFLGLLGQVGQL